MADIRALLAAEKQSRRINHPYASYSVRNVLSCSVCNLAIKSEALWEGHLKSANHRKNAAQGGSRPSHPAASQQQLHTQDNSIAVRKVSDSTKRKRDIDDVDGEERQSQVESPRPSNGSALVAGAAPSPRDGGVPNDRQPHDVEVGGRKKPKADTDGHNGATQSIPQNKQAAPKKHVSFAPDVESTPTLPPTSQATPTPAIDEDEWAAFESDISRLESQPPPAPGQQSQPARHSPSDPSSTYSATITAAPQLLSSTAQTNANTSTDTDTQGSRKSLLEAELEAEKEEEQARMEDEFEVMEKMEGRVRRLKEKRESLRLGIGNVTGTSMSESNEHDDDPNRVRIGDEHNSVDEDVQELGQAVDEKSGNTEGSESEGKDEVEEQYRTRIAAALARARTDSAEFSDGDEQGHDLKSTTNINNVGDKDARGSDEDDDDDDDDDDVDDWYS